MLPLRETVQITSHKWKKKTHKKHNRSIPCRAASSSELPECKMSQWGNASLCSHCAGYPEHMTLSDFRCHFQALSPPIMKRYASMFVSHDERKVRLRLQGPSSLPLLLCSWPTCWLAFFSVCPRRWRSCWLSWMWIGGASSWAPAGWERWTPTPSGRGDGHAASCCVSQVFMKRGVLRYLEQQRDQQVTGWLVYLQASCMGHLARQRYRKLKVRQCSQCQRHAIVSLRHSKPLPQSLTSFSFHVFFFVFERSALSSLIKLLWHKSPEGGGKYQQIN